MKRLAGLLLLAAAAAQAAPPLHGPYKDVTRGLGSQNIDHRLRNADFAKAEGVRYLGTSIASLSALQRVLVVGSNLRKDHPLFAQRIRQAARKGAQVHSLHALADDWLMTVGTRLVAAPSAWLQSLADVAPEVSDGHQVDGIAMLGLHHAAIGGHAARLRSIEKRLSLADARGA